MAKDSAEYGFSKILYAQVGITMDIGPFPPAFGSLPSYLYILFQQ